MEQHTKRTQVASRLTRTQVASRLTSEDFVDSTSTGQTAPTLTNSKHRKCIDNEYCIYYDMMSVYALHVQIEKPFCSLIHK